MIRALRASSSRSLKSNWQRLLKSRVEHAAPLRQSGREASGKTRVSRGAFAFGASVVANTTTPAIAAATAILMTGLNVIFMRITRMRTGQWQKKPAVSRGFEIGRAKRSSSKISRRRERVESGRFRIRLQPVDVRCGSYGRRADNPIHSNLGRRNNRDWSASR